MAAKRLKILAGATGLEPAASGVTGRQFVNNFNGTLDKSCTITCAKSAQSLRSVRRILKERLDDRRTRQRLTRSQGRLTEYEAIRDVQRGSRTQRDHYASSTLTFGHFCPLLHSCDGEWDGQTGPVHRRASRRSKDARTFIPRRGAARVAMPWFG